MTSLTAIDPSNVRLLPGPILQRQDRNHQYLLSLDVDRLLHNFRLNAGLPSDAEPLGGWEAPGHGLRGHFVGHYLSACGHLFQATGDPRLLQRVDALIDGLAACQAALGNGYLAAIPESDLEQIETRFEGEWASYYVVHKIFAGLIDAFKLCRNEQALTMAQRLADHIRHRLDKLSPDQWRHMLLTTRPNPTNETGAWSESLLELFAITQNPEYQQLARKFDCEWLLGPLARGEDPLTGLHANTHIPILLGAARRHEITGEPAFRRAVEYFWQRTAVARSFVNGGSSGPRPDGLEKSKGAEHWPEAFRLAMTLTPKINESCVTHNMLRLTDTLYRWTGDAIYADFFERGYFNHVLAMQNRSELGGYLYDHPLGSCSRKVFGHSHDAFWCCYGSSIEAFSRLAAGIFYQADDALIVNLPVAAEVRWRGVRVTQSAAYPFDGSASLSIACDTPTVFTLKIRIPSWCQANASATLNGRAVTAGGGRYLSIARTWNSGDVVALQFPLTLRVETMPDDPTLIAFLSGPHVLAALSEEAIEIPAASAEEAIAQVRIDPKTTTGEMTLAAGKRVELIPLSEVGEEIFGVYHRLKPE